MGLPMLFIRTNRCNLRCKWCDSTYTFSGGTDITIDELMRTVEASSEKWICLTGGEPLLQRESPELVNRITGSGRSVLLETSGSLPIDPYVHSKSITIDMDVKTPSSGEEKNLHRQNLKLLRKNDYLKFVIADMIDYEYARRFISENEFSCEVVFQPAWGTEMRWIADSVLNDRLDVRILPQLHKLIWGEIRGV